MLILLVESFEKELVSGGFSDVSIVTLHHRFEGTAEQLLQMAIRSVGYTIPKQHLPAFQDMFLQKAQTLRLKEQALATVNVGIAYK